MMEKEQVKKFLDEFGGKVWITSDYCLYKSNAQLVEECNLTFGRDSIVVLRASHEVDVRYLTEEGEQLLRKNDYYGEKQLAMLMYGDKKYSKKLSNKVLTTCMKKQKYRYADVFIKWEDEDCPERVTISLSEENDPNDEKVFYHCKDYEEFIELVAYAGNTEDFHVVSILELY